MTHIGPIDLKKKPAIIAVILEKPLETPKKAAEIGADILEIRLDLLGIKDRDIAAETIRKIKSETGLPIIITTRSYIEGGKWNGRESERIGLIKDLLSLKEGPDAVDIELYIDEDERDKTVELAKNNGKTVIISSHDFSKTPSFTEMKATLEDAFIAGADIAKLAVMPRSMKNILDLLRVTLDVGGAGKAICTIAMGDLGKHTRVIAPYYGSVMTYASVENTRLTPPGQLPLEKLKKIMEFLE